MTPLEKEFHREMVSIYERAESEAGYPANYFIQMVAEQGGVATARQLVLSTAPSEGFTALWQRNDWTSPSRRSCFSHASTSSSTRRCGRRLDHGSMPTAGRFPTRSSRSLGSHQHRQRGGEVPTPAGIFCLEGDWSRSIASRQSVEPLLRLLEDCGAARYVHRDVATRAEARTSTSRGGCAWPRRSTPSATWAFTAAVGRCTSAVASPWIWTNSRVDSVPAAPAGSCTSVHVRHLRFATMR